MNPRIGKVAVVWRGDRQLRKDATPANNRLHRIFEELNVAGFEAEPCVYDEEIVDDVRAQLSKVDAVLVWVDPISGGNTRRQLDDLLRDIAAKDIFVSAHPDTILKMGTKRVLYDTKHLGWGADTHIYQIFAEFRDEFPSRLKVSGPRVLKQHRGNGGNGVWKIEFESLSTTGAMTVRILHALRGSTPETLPLDTFLMRCSAYFENSGLIIDQPFQARLPDGMIRCYMSTDKVVGFGHQLIKALIPPPLQGPDAPEAQPGPRIMHGPDAAPFQSLRRMMEDEWVPGMMQAVRLQKSALPIIWDADFLYGPRDAAGADTYVLCEINVSSVFPIPDEAPAAIARSMRERILVTAGN